MTNVITYSITSKKLMATIASTDVIALAVEETIFDFLGK